jgi:hypothetical protein
VAGGGLWLYRTAPRPGSVESLWSRSTVRSYPGRWLEDRGVLPGAFILAAKKRACPESWSDPATLIAYHKGTDRILVINSPGAQDEVVRLMHELTRKTAKKDNGG